MWGGVDMWRCSGCIELVCRVEWICGMECLCGVE